ncbi:MAG: thioredoxin 1 [Myxococcota bacterium]|jgi:thioredoxin 1
MSTVPDVTDATFDAEVMQSDVPVLVDFWATWCAPCKAIAPHVQTLADETEGRLKVVKLDVQSNMKIAMKFKVTSIPVLMVIKNGEVVGRKNDASGGLHALRTLVKSHV